MRIWAVLLAVWPLALPAADRSETLADLRAGVTALRGEIVALQEELAPAQAAQIPGKGGSALQRLTAIERELQRLTAKIEELEYHIRQHTTQATTRLATLEGRLCAMDPECAPGAQQVEEGATPLPSLDQLNERALFASALAALRGGAFDQALTIFQTQLARFPQGPLATEATLRKGEAHEGELDHAAAARSYLAAFSRDRSGPLAAQSLTRLGHALAMLGQVNEACVTLGEVSLRFPDSPQVAIAQAERAEHDCP